MRRHPRLRPSHRRRSERVTAHEDQVVYWILRTLVHAGAARSALRKERRLGEDVLEAVGVQAPAPELEGAKAERQVFEGVKQRLAQLEGRDIAQCMASRNAELMGQVLGLGRTEVAVLGFIIALDAEEPLRECFAELRCRGLTEIVRAMARVLGRRRADVERALGRDGALRKLSLVTLTRRDAHHNGPITLNEAAANVLLRPLADAQDLVRHFLQPTEPAGVTLDDYPHLAADVALLERYLRAALARRQKGVNILLHGPPGTGKTELSRALSAKLGATLDAVAVEDEDNDALGAGGRLESYALCQRILRGRRKALLLFDEAEDAFPRARSWAGLGFGESAGRHKAWTNQLLESNPIPTLWVSNAIRQMDRAFVRRFDFVLELPQPPRSVRRRVIDKHLQGLPVDPAAVERLADREALSPGHVQQAAKVLRLLRPRTAAEAGADLGRIVDANLRAFAGSARTRRSERDLPYDASLLNVSVDVEQLVQGLSRARSGTLCFHGAPGTGKTALAAHIARQLDVPLSAHRASDLLSKWVGQTEQQIARMFEGAAADGALLLLDEADSFLADRRGARMSWELTQVNEMLTQMEHFDGLFICSTNLMDHLDRAALRRFAIKVKFDSLKTEQAARLFDTTLAVLGGLSGVVDAGEHVATELRRLHDLTPGDYASVTRKLRTLGVQPTPDELLSALREECDLKGDARRGRLGFGG